MKILPDFSKYTDGLVPAIIQDTSTNKVLMLGFMNEESLRKTIAEKKVTFYSRSQKKLWTKGETSGNFLHLSEIKADCDNDTLLITATPAGPVCHKGTETCFGETNEQWNLKTLELIIEMRKNTGDITSYTYNLFASPIPKIAQKVGEEAVELVIESLGKDDSLFLNEAADLLFHYMVLLQAKGYKLDDVTSILRDRNKQK